MARSAQAIVLDSSFLIAYHNTRDVHHAAAARLMVQIAGGAWGRALLLEYVFLEVVTVLRSRRDLETAVGVGTALLDAREVDFVPCSPLFADAWRELSSRRASPLSFVDAAIAVTARTRAAGNVATFDNDFRGVPGVTVVPS